MTDDPNARQWPPPSKDRRARMNAQAGRAATYNTRDTTEAWLESLGQQLIEVRFYRRGRWICERHVDDHDTFLTTVDMAMERLKVRCAMWLDEDRAVVLDRKTGNTREFPSREAAEMWMIHHA